MAQIQVIQDMLNSEVSIDALSNFTSWSQIMLIVVGIVGGLLVLSIIILKSKFYKELN